MTGLRKANDKRYEPIDEWSREARGRLVDLRGDEIRILLDAAFSDFLDAEPNASLAAFGFRGDDPVAEAVEWSLDRFTTGDLDPNGLSPDSRSFRLFTEVRFWLAQKVGRRAYERIFATARAPRPPSNIEAREEKSPVRDDAAESFGAEMASELPAFRDRTCSDIVGFWLEGTKQLRRFWFSWSDSGHLAADAADLSKKQRSFYAHDAMFRFLCCFFHLIPASDDALADRAFELTCLSGCPNVTPYRKTDRLFLAVLSVRGPRDVSRLRKEGARRFVNACLDRVERKSAFVARDRLAAELTRKSLGPTTLHALGIEDDPALRARLDRVLAAEPEDNS